MFTAFMRKEISMGVRESAMVRKMAAPPLYRAMKGMENRVMVR